LKGETKVAPPQEGLFDASMYTEGSLGGREIVENPLQGDSEDMDQALEVSPDQDQLDI
jgi:hypothetical protein